MLCGFSGLVRIRYFRVVWTTSVLAWFMDAVWGVAVLVYLQWMWSGLLVRIWVGWCFVMACGWVWLILVFWWLIVGLCNLVVGFGCWFV